MIGGPHTPVLVEPGPAQRVTLLLTPEDAAAVREARRAGWVEVHGQGTGSVRFRADSRAAVALRRAAWCAARAGVNYRTAAVVEQGHTFEPSQPTLILCGWLDVTGGGVTYSG